MYCANCGSVVEERSKFCKMCGAPVNGNTVEQPVPAAPAQTQVQVRASGQVKNTGVIPTPMYVIGLIINIFNLIFGTGTFVMGIFSYAVTMVSSYIDNSLFAFAGTLISGFAAGASFIAIILGLSNRSKPKNGVSKDKTSSFLAFIILTIVSSILFIIGAYIVGTVMETSLG